MSAESVAPAGAWFSGAAASSERRGWWARSRPWRRSTASILHRRVHRRNLGRVRALVVAGAGVSVEQLIDHQRSKSIVDGRWPGYSWDYEKATGGHRPSIPRLLGPAAVQVDPSVLAGGPERCRPLPCSPRSCRLARAPWTAWGTWWRPSPCTASGPPARQRVDRRPGLRERSARGVRA